MVLHSGTMYISLSTLYLFDPLAEKLYFLEQQLKHFQARCTFQPFYFLYTEIANDVLFDRGSSQVKKLFVPVCMYASNEAQ